MLYSTGKTPISALFNKTGLIDENCLFYYMYSLSGSIKDILYNEFI